MDIKFYKNISDNNVLNKNITIISSHDIRLKDECNVMTPSILIRGDISNDINYAFIEKWNRYYYVKDKKSINNGMYEISLSVDVLMSHKNKILNSDGIIYNSENLKNDYIASENYTNDIREKTRIINFSGGFNDAPEFVLITAGATII